MTKLMYAVRKTLRNGAKEYFNFQKDTTVDELEAGCLVDDFGIVNEIEENDSTWEAIMVTVKVDKND